MNVIEAIHGRRSIRAYTAQRLERTTVADLIWDAAQAPTPPVSGDTPWAFCVIEGRECLAGYGARAKQYAFEHQPADAPWSWTSRPGFRVFWDAPAAVILCARRGNRETPFDCCRVAQNLILAAHARGLGSCWVGAPIPWLRSDGVAGELGLPAGFEAEAVVILGYADEHPVGNPRARPPITWCNPVEEA